MLIPALLLDSPGDMGSSTRLPLLLCKGGQAQLLQQR